MPLPGWTAVCLVALAGALGALARWGLSSGVQWLVGTRWPAGTLVVNVLGCFLFGLVIEWVRRAPAESEALRLFWLTGLAGAFTTFSTFAFDTYELGVMRDWRWAAGNVLLQLVLGMSALVVGLAAARLS